MNLTQIILFLLVGAFGGFVGNKLRLPAGTFMGSMFAVGLTQYYNLLSLERSVILIFLIQLLLGFSLGVSFSSIDKAQFKKLTQVLIIVTFGVLLMTFGIGYLLSLFTYLDLRTLFLATAPGGLAEMSIIAKSIDLNPPVVAIFHVIRLIVVLFVFSIILKYTYRRLNHIEKQEEVEVQKDERNNIEL